MKISKEKKNHIYYEMVNECEKDNPWLTMVHGFTQNHTIFNRQVEHFKKKCNLLLIDLRGHGRSDNLSPYGIEEYCDDVSEVLKAVGIKNNVYWGTHTGGAIGLLLALRNSDGVRALILESPSLPGFPMPRVDELINRARDIAIKENILNAIDDWFQHADWFSNMHNKPDFCRRDEHLEVIKQFYGEPFICQQQPRLLTPVSDMLKKINLPVLLYNGEYDVDDFKKAAEKIKSDIKNCTKVEISQSGGFPLWENPDEVNSIVDSFLNKLYAV